jgi:hypothetical protein
MASGYRVNGSAIGGLLYTPKIGGDHAPASCAPDRMHASRQIWAPAAPCHVTIRSRRCRCDLPCNHGRGAEPLSGGTVNWVEK